MKTITEKLADALRGCMVAANVKGGEQAVRAAVMAAASAGLAEWGAQHGQVHPDTDAFLAAAAVGHNADYYQITEDPIDRVESGAWVALRAFISNEDSGLGE